MERLLLAPLSGAVSDTTLAQIIRGQLNCDLVACKNSDIVLAHFARYVRSHNVSIFQLHPEHRVGERFDYCSLHFNKIFFRHFGLPFKSINCLKARYYRYIKENRKI